MADSIRHHAGALIAWIALGLSVSLAHDARANSGHPGECLADSMAMLSSSHGVPLGANNGVFTLSSDQVSFGSSPLTITLGSIGNLTINGLLMYASRSDRSRVGDWTFPSGYGPQSCGLDPNATVGHTSAIAKPTPVQFTWTPPADPTLDYVTFYAMVVVTSNLRSWYVLTPLTVHSAVTAVDDPHAALTLSLLPGLPNPFSHETDIEYVLPMDESVRLMVTDISGRHVRNLVWDDQLAGLHVASWDATDDSGRLVASGVYLVTLEAQGTHQTRRLVFLRSANL